MVMKTGSAVVDRNAAEQITQILAQLLADTYIAYVKTQNYHWNLIDPRFHSLHKMFEENYQQLADATDEIAERIRQLKMKSSATMREFLEMGTLSEGDNNFSGDEMIQDLLQDREALAHYIRPKIEQVIKLGDEGTGDMLIQHLKMHDKAAWMLRSTT